jgi:hypothetical protein
MKKLSFAFSMLTLFAFAGQAYGQLAVTDLKTAELDADGKPELHLLLTGIRGPTTNLRFQTDTVMHRLSLVMENQHGGSMVAVGTGSYSR